MSIYTKKGDKGETGLLGGSRIGKDSLKVTCYGTLDEANAALGVAYSLLSNHDLRTIIHNVQKQLFVVGAELASDEKGKGFIQNPISQNDIFELEKTIDRFEEILGPIHEFIIPGETTASAQLHLARAIIRRAERLMVEMNKTISIRDELLKFTNRLSDVLFMVARAEVHYSLIAKVKSEVIERMNATKRIKIDLELATKMAKAVERKAESIGVPIVFSVVDDSGNLLLLHRMEGSLLASLELSPNKAHTAVSLKMKTNEVAKLVQPGEALYGLQHSHPNRIVAFGGGFPLIMIGECIGGIGVSGGTVEEDMLLAEYALEIFERWKEGNYIGC